MENIERNIFSSSLELEYYGIELKEHEMSAEDLSFVIKSINGAFKELNFELNGNTASIDVRVKANFKQGSFIIEFIINILPEIKELYFFAIDLLVNKNVELVLNFFGVVHIFQSVVNFIKRKKGKELSEADIKELHDEIKKINKVNNALSESNEKLHEKLEDLCEKIENVYNSKRFRKNVENFISPLKKDGIDKLKIKYKDTVTIINKEDVRYYDAPEIVEDGSNEKVVQTTLYIKTLSFDRKIKWKLFNSRYGNISVLIADEVFLHNVEKNIEQFSKDDKLEVILYIEKIENKYGKPKYMYIIKKVIKHIPYHEEPELPF